MYYYFWPNVFARFSFFGENKEQSFERFVPNNISFSIHTLWLLKLFP